MNEQLYPIAHLIRKSVYNALGHQCYIYGGNLFFFSLFFFSHLSLINDVTHCNNSRVGTSEDGPQITLSKSELAKMGMSVSDWKWMLSHKV